MDIPDPKPIRQRIETINRLLREQGGKVKELPNPHARGAVHKLTTELRGEKDRLVMELLEALRAQLNAASDLVSNALGLGPTEAEGYRGGNLHAVAQIMQHDEHEGLAQGRREKNLNLEIKSLEDAITEQHKLLKWAREAQGKPPEEPVDHLEAYG